MPLEFTAFHSPPQCQGDDWTVVDERVLARVVAFLLVGHYLHVHEILTETAGEAPRVRSEVIAEIVELLSSPERDGSAPWHRDGWLFQMISWVAAVRSGPHDSVVRAPQARPADKGFDGLIVTNEGGVRSLVICEDKATGRPRETVRDDVWPEIEMFEAGARDHELINELSALLTREGDLDVVLAIVRDLLFDGRRRYRVSVTARGSRDPRRLFRGFEDVVSGPVERRGANVLSLDAVRDWFRGFSVLVVEELDAMERE